MYMSISTTFNLEKNKSSIDFICLITFVTTMPESSACPIYCAMSESSNKCTVLSVIV